MKEFFINPEVPGYDKLPKCLIKMNLKCIADIVNRALIFKTALIDLNDLLDHFLLKKTRKSLMVTNINTMNLRKNCQE